MCAHEHFQPSPTHLGFSATLVAPSNAKLNRTFYASVGSQWQWTDRLTWLHEDWQRYVERDGLKTFVGQLNGQDIGYFELETQKSGNVELVYFGLLPEYIGKGLGGTLLSAAVEHAWQIMGTKRVWLHTCTQDHKHALDNYLARGFKLLKPELE